MAEEANIARNRRRRVVGILAAGLALGGAAAVAPSTAGQAAPTGAAPSVRADRPTKLPHSRTGKFTPPTPGQKGPLFQSTSSPADPRVVGGTTVSAAQYPWIVGIVTYLDNRPLLYWCTGTVIAPNKVLTAAHCTGDGAGTTRVIAGHDQLLDQYGNVIPNVGYVAEVRSTWIHPAWNIAAQYDEANPADILDDVAVLTLKQNLPSAYTPISLAAQGETAYAAGDTADVVGYGIAYENNVEVQDTRLRKASVPILSDAACAADANAAYIGYDANRLLCAGNGGGTMQSPVPDTCGGDSGGPLLVNGKQVGITDWGHGDYCGEHPGFYEEVNYYADLIGADAARPAAPNLDWTGDGHADLIARDSSGQLRLYVGTGFSNDGYGGFWSARVINKGWGSFKRIFRVYNWNGDRKPSIMAVNSSGELWLYNGDGKGGFSGAAKKLGSGWGGFTALVPTSNWLGNGKPGLLARKSTGELIRYDGNGAGGWASGSGTKIGSGWNGFNVFLTPGSWQGNGNEALIVRKTSTGELFRYESDSKGGWATSAGVKINSGWGSFKAILTPGDWSGDNMIDLLGVDSSGKLRIYPTDGKGNWLPGGAKQINAGWGSVNPIF